MFYSLQHLGRRAREPHEATDAGPAHEGGFTAYHLHLGGFAVYVCLMGYLLVRGFEETPVSTLLFAVAIAFHFLSVDNSLRGEHGAAYERGGRHLLAAMAPLGWVLGLAVSLSPFALALMVAFISGGVIVNSAIMELSDVKQGRLLPFLVGGVLYGLVLLPLG